MWNVCEYVGCVWGDEACVECVRVWAECEGVRVCDGVYGVG